MDAANEQERDWSQLPIEILELIASRVCLSNYHLFGSVCTPWRLATTMSKTTTLLQPHFPWLMLPKDRTRKTRGFYCLHHNSIYHHPIPRVVHQSWSCGSSHGWLIMSHRTRGDFLFNPFLGARIQLPKHPVFGDFADSSEFYPYYVTKAILSSQPNSESTAKGNCIVAAIFDNYLVAICRPGDPEWTWSDLNQFDDEEEDHDGNDHEPDDNGGGGINGDDGDREDKEDVDDDNVEEAEYNVFVGGKTIFELGFGIGLEEELVSEKEGEVKGEDNRNDDDDEEENRNNDEGYDEEEEEEVHKGAPNISDIIFHNGKLYAISKKTQVYVCEIDNGNITWSILQTQPLKLTTREQSGSKLKYLVESPSSVLLMVVRILDELKTKKFIVFKLDDQQSSHDPPKWVRVASLGDQILFLGQNYSKCVKVSDFPGLERNCIYYTDDFRCHLGGQPMFQFQYKDSGVFSLDRCKLKQFLLRNYRSFIRGYVHSFRYPPIWIC